MKIKHYTVSGSGRFPIDMLRYDQSFPESEVDSVEIEKTGKRTVRLATYSNHVEISAVRWSSFGWTMHR